jgi:hypothetical protein
MHLSHDTLQNLDRKNINHTRDWQNLCRGPGRLQVLNGLQYLQTFTKAPVHGLNTRTCEGKVRLDASDTTTFGCFRDAA